ncbi:Uncharacterized protein OBRU01_24365 [Operophtera brumata]|uniref:Spaetzle domain-containing protein n=1 Tax=Operophtera brumata TaxID=104452 RepID=A0A0L7KGL4_OPEBR|nr:Uncharacterized protein OBRU01_24365 [Operophtera brumata]
MTASWKQPYRREMQTIMQREGGNPEKVECCPSVLETIYKKGGRTTTSHYVELYEDGEIQQALYERSCAEGVADKPCRFVDARLYNESRCVQTYSYSYALVRYLPSAATPPHRVEGQFSVPNSNGWSMNYVKVRAGCECQIKPQTKRSTKKNSVFLKTMRPDSD